MARQTPPSVQIHHTGNDHWFLSIQDTSGTVFLLNNKNPQQTVSASTQIQMSRVYSSNGNVIPVNLPTVQQQTNSIDCGVFAIVYATEYGFNQ
jgi:Ulp1 family protease